MIKFLNPGFTHLEVTRIIVTDSDLFSCYTRSLNFIDETKTLSNLPEGYVCNSYVQNYKKIF